jgi:PAP2 superfamily protein
MTTGLLPEALARRLRVEVRAPATVRQLEHALPALALLWVPVVVAVWARLPGTSDFAQGLPMLRAMLIGGLAPLLVAGGIARLRAGSVSGAGRLLRSEGWLTERLIRHVLMSVSLAAFFWAFSCWKSMIPQVHAFSWDERLWSLGTWIHGGQPDVLLAPVFGGPRTIVALDDLYETWWFVLFGLLLWQVWQRDLARAKRFLLAFALVWIVLGIFVATAFSSAGPCFARLITGTHRYDELFARLNAANAISPLTALQAQAFLWTAHVRGLVPPGGGISAFPSLHVAGTILGALAISERSRALGAFAWTYMVLVWIASIMLGWHYSLDGYVAVLGTAACWWVAGRLTTPIPAPPVPIAQRIASWRAPSHAVVAVEAVGARMGGRMSWTLWP